MRSDLPKSVRNYALLWFSQVKNILENAEKTGDPQSAFISGVFLISGLSLAASLRLIRPKDIQHWEEYATAKSADLEYSLFGPNLEIGHAS